MDRYKKLEHIANAIHAAGKIKDTYKSNVRDASDTAVKPDNITLLNNMLQIVAEYSPGMQKGLLSQTTNKCNSYSCAYRNLKQHLNSLNGRGMDRESLIKTISIIKPFMRSRHSHFIDKMVKIHEILKS